jgi:glycolate oxidase iron-sulfur subunit
MTQMKLIPGLKAPTEEEYLNCIRCGLCLSVCPLYREDLTETAAPRGHVALTRKLLERDLKPTPNLFEQMYRCFGCLACNEICPVGIKPADLAMEMRHLEEQIHPSLWKRLLFNHVIFHPKRLEGVTWPLRLYQGLGIRRLYYALGLSWLMPSYMRDLEAMLPRLPHRPLRRILPEITEAIGEARYTVGFFLGCAQTLMFAEESAATVHVLSINGCNVITPKEAKCCGMPAIGYGRHQVVIEAAKHNIELFEKYDMDAIITDCATCGSTLKEYETILSNDPGWAARAKAFSDKVKDVSEFLGDIPLKKPECRMDLRVTYHDPCHLRRAQGVWEAPRNLLQMIDGLNFVELPEANWCCGSAGSQLITHYETSLQVLQRKIDNVEGTEAQVVTSGCPGCQMQLQVGIRRRRRQMKVTHPIVLLERAYGGDS